MNLITENNFIQPLLTDFYQISMAYSYWKSGKINEHAVFELYFRKNPFKGEYTIFAGLENCLNLIKNFRYSESDIEFLKSILPSEIDQEFFEYLRKLTTDEIDITAMPEGTVAFPKVPLMIIEGPLIVGQLLETGLLNLVNFASLVATNAARFRQAAGEDKQLLEFGLRRAQGPDGGICASRNCYLGGFNGTSNVLAAKLFNIPIKGTHAHSYISSYESLKDIKYRTIRCAMTNTDVDFIDLVLQWHSKTSQTLEIPQDQTKEGELAAFICYALAFPSQFLCLVDTYDVMKSGIPNFIAVGLALNQCGYRPLGIRIDSGDLAYLSTEIRGKFHLIAKSYEIPWFSQMTIVASNDINEDTLHSLNQQGHSIDSFGIGTHLVTCQKQPALGCVYKLVEINGRASIKLSEDIEKITLPGKKSIYRFYGKDGLALMDHMTRANEILPTEGHRILCRHPSDASKRAHVIPTRVAKIHILAWTKGQLAISFPSLEGMRDHARASLSSLRADHKRALNPTPYKVSVSSDLYDFIQEMWMIAAPIGELS